MKFPFISFKLLEKILRKNINLNSIIKTWSRSSTILPIMLNNSILGIYNGKKFIPLILNNEEIIGHKLGEFSLSRILPKHTSKDKKLGQKHFKQRKKEKKLYNKTDKINRKKNVKKLIDDIEF